MAAGVPGHRFLLFRPSIAGDFLLPARLFESDKGRTRNQNAVAASAGLGFWQQTPLQIAGNAFFLRFAVRRPADKTDRFREITHKLNQLRLTAHSQPRRPQTSRRPETPSACGHSPHHDTRTAAMSAARFIDAVGPLRPPRNRSWVSPFDQLVRRPTSGSFPATVGFQIATMRDTIS